MIPGWEDGEEFFLLTHSYGSMPVIAASEGNSFLECKVAGKKGGTRGVVVVASGVVTTTGDSVVGKCGGQWPPYYLPDSERPVDF